MVAGVIWAESEFGHGGDCGPNAGAMAESWADQKYRGVATPGQTATDQMHNRMRASGLCDPSGVTTMGKLEAQINRDGFKTERWRSGAWLDFMKARNGAPAVFPILFQNAHVLRDALTWAGMDAGPGLRGHFVMAAEYHAGGYSARSGKTLPEGFYVADGDSDVNNPVVNGRRTRRIADHRLVFYSVANLQAADIVDVLAVYPRVSFAPAPPPPAPHALPDGWSDDGTTLTGANGQPVVRGFREYVRAKLLAGAWQGGYAYLPERNDGGDGSLQWFADALLLWNPRQGVYEGSPADMCRVGAHEAEGKPA